MLTKNGKDFGGERNKKLAGITSSKQRCRTCGFGGGLFYDYLDGNDNDTDMFSLDNYGQSLQPAMTRELEEKINRDVE